MKCKIEFIEEDCYWVEAEAKDLLVTGSFLMIEDGEICYSSIPDRHKHKKMCFPSHRILEIISIDEDIKVVEK